LLPLKPPRLPLLKLPLLKSPPLNPLTLLRSKPPPNKLAHRRALWELKGLPQTLL
jgi:hypothetical protein